MRLPILAAAGLVALAVVVGPVSTASAQYSGICSLALSGSRSPNRTTSQIVVRGQNFPPGTSIPILLDGSIQLGTAQVTPGGTFATQVTLPAGLHPGPHTISVACATTGEVSTVSTQVLSVDFNRDLRITPASVRQGGTLTVTSTGWTPGATVKHVLTSDPVNMGTAAAGSDGVATLTYPVPRTVAAGAHTVTVSGEAADGTAANQSGSVTVLAAAAGRSEQARSQGSVAATGSDTGPITALGTGAVVVGAALVAAARRRRRAA